MLAIFQDFHKFIVVFINMNEGYYEEPMKWTWRTTSGVYENDRREGIVLE